MDPTMYREILLYKTMGKYPEKARKGGKFIIRRRAGQYVVQAAVPRARGGGAAVPRARGGGAAVPIAKGGGAAVPRARGGGAAVPRARGGGAAVPRARGGGAAAARARGERGEEPASTTAPTTTPAVQSGTAAVCGPSPLAPGHPSGLLGPPFARPGAQESAEPVTVLHLVPCSAPPKHQDVAALLPDGA
ncbi:uncharacterized protein LOC131737490 [Acipenser ruthenus]|uniref:uncharacterized protein LOC131730018 n=1 Tax=Acipenser ruthenus TaxID=7906 RepID=UPI0027412E3E|nr:uncharacterized protein LOC131730018 [Acipenser ruthenus]XP_058882752.1 uncharacterized protein LOC131737490 [Acipenser ruthenus]